MRMRRLAGMLLCAAAASMMSGMVGPAWAGVERVGLVEVMVCAGSPESGLSETAAADLADLYGERQMALLAYHPSDDGLGTVETDARISAYGDPGLPFCIFDGMVPVAHGWGTVRRAYEGRLDDRLALDQMSPIDVAVDFIIAGPDTTARARVLVVDALGAGTYEVHMAVFEDSVTHETDLYRYVVRDLLDPEALTVSVPGDSQVVEHTISIAPEWELSRVGVVAFVQDVVSMEVLQAGVYIPDVRKAEHNVSLRRGGTSLMVLEEIFPGFWQAVSDTCGYRNVGASPDADSMVILLDQDLPGGWRADPCTGAICLLGDSVLVPFPYPPDTTEVLHLSMFLDSTQVPVNDSLMAEAAGSRIRLTVRSYLDPSRDQTVEYILVTDTMPDIMFINGGDETAEAAFAGALEEGEYRHTVWDLLYQHSPQASELADYDVLIWNGGQSGGMTAGEEATLTGYLDGGGGLYLSSQDYLDYLLPGGSTLSQDYLHVGSWSTDVGCAVATGDPGDTIGDGLVLPLDYATVGYDDWSDELYGGDRVFSNPGGNRCAVAYHSGDPGTFAAVFTAFPFEAVSEAAPDPNNRATLMGRIVEWLLSPIATEVADGPGGLAEPTAFWLGQNRPNPFSGNTLISYAVGPERANVSISIYNVQGQLVRRLADGEHAPGGYVVEWDGCDQRGRPTGTGIYLLAMRPGGTGGDEKLLLKKMARVR